MSRNQQAELNQTFALNQSYGHDLSRDLSAELAVPYASSERLSVGSEAVTMEDNERLDKDLPEAQHNRKRERYLWMGVGGGIVGLVILGIIIGVATQSEPDLILTGELNATSTIKKDVKRTPAVEGPKTELTTKLLTTTTTTTTTEAPTTTTESATTRRPMPKHKDFPSDGSVLDFFGLDDALDIKWYHGANSLAEMQKALDGDYMMLEGDIHLRWYGFPNQTNEPVMTHDAGTDSDNTLDNWLSNILARSDKAPKLDFKSQDVVEPSLQILASKEVNHPIWVNADVVRGPGGSPPKFNPQEFLALVDDYYADVTLSLGWTTSCCMWQYNRQHMEDMLAVTANLSQPVTFPARAGILNTQAWEHFRWLLNQDQDRYTMTVWTPSGRDDWEGATEWDMLYIRNDFPKARIYYDLPGDKFQKFQELAIPAGSPLNHIAGMEQRDGLLVTWAHAVNSQQELDDALSSDLMMLEADVLLRGQGTDDQTDIPVMAHPPATDSDITLQEWLDRVVQTDRGIKLDFKSVEVLEPAMQVLKAVKDKIQQPVWLNADILRGPRGGSPVDAAQFKQVVLEHFPWCTLSIGWTTGWSNLPGSPVYTEAMVGEMLEYVQDLDQPVTYPIRAAMVARSWDVLKPLLQESRARTLTIWSSRNDNVDIDGLVRMRLDPDTDVDRIYYDLPDDQMQEFLAKLNMTSPAV